MTAVALTRAAREDLKSIARHTHARWGLAQRNRYLREIDRTLRALGSNPLLGRNCDEIRAGYRKLPHGSHVIYYRQDADALLVVRILHAAMDVDMGIAD